jgi:hypothetical protein
VNGIFAIKALIDMLMNYKGMQSSERSHFLKDLCYKLFLIFYRHRLFKLYLELSSNVVKDAYLNIAISQTSEITNYWNTAIMCVLKASITNSESTYDKIINIFKRIELSEIENYESLNRIRSIL